MTPAIAFVLLVLVGMAALFALERLRMDVVGFLALTCLLFGQVLTVPEALAGFSDPTVHMIAALFVVGGGIFQTGLADRLAQRLGALAGKSPRRLLLMIMLATSALSAFLSSTGTVAVMIPVVATLARRAQVSPSQLMMPLAFATLLGGLLTLIATPPNIVVSNALAQAGREPFGFFDFTGPGLCLLGAGVTFILLFGRRLLPVRDLPADDGPQPSAAELWARYGLDARIFELAIAPDSPLAGRTIGESAIRSRFRVGVFAVRKRRDAPAAQAERAHADHRLEAGDVLTVKAAEGAVEAFCAEMQLTVVGRPAALPSGLVVAEAIVPPGSSFVGKTVAEARLRTRFGVNVMAVFRSTAVLRDSVAHTTLSVGDLLLLLGSEKALRKLRDARGDAILVTETEAIRQAQFRTERAPHAVAILLAMLMAMAFELAPPVVAVVCAALAMVLVGCIDVQSADKTINWQSVLLIATVLPFSTALTKTGAIDLIVRGLVHSVGGAGPYVVMTALFALTSAVGLFVSNTATSVLVAPVAMQVADSLGLRPEALLMTVAVAASAAFLTPVSSPVNMLVMNAGDYRFGDFAKLGAPLLIITWLGTLLVVPWFFPFAAP